jgi:DNA repair exonuclease SbcCD nuclease subunit
VADLHFSVGTGECRDTDKVPCVGDADTLQWLEEALDAEKPDLVVRRASPYSAVTDIQVFSGDQLNGQKTSYDARSVSAKFTKPVIDRQIPWCVIFGNHDSEIADDRAEQMRALQSLPYSLAQPGPANVDGVGNCEYRTQ